MPFFLSPLFLIGSVAAALPIVLHLLRREPEPRVRFAAVRLLRGGPVELTRRRRLREFLLLALRVAALFLLAAAFARPFVTGGVSASSETTVVALDTSYSMSAPGRFARARTLAKEAMDRAVRGGAVALITFADTAVVASPPGTDRSLSMAAVDAAAPGFGATRYRAALDAAVQLLNGGAGKIVFVTDLQESGWDGGSAAPIPESVRVELADAGAFGPNLGVSAFRVAGDRGTAVVRNGGDTLRETRVRLVLDGRAAGDAVLSIGPHATASADFTVAANAREAVVSIDDPGGIAADDVRYAVVGDGDQPTVLVITATGNLAREGFYLRQALAGGEKGGSRYRIVGAAADRMGAEPSESLSAHAAIVLLSTSGLERRGREALAAYVKDGGGLMVAAGPEVDGAVVADVLGPDARLRVSTAADAPRERSLVPLDIRHPLFQAFGSSLPALGLVTFRRLASIESPACQTIARMTTGETALLSCDVGRGRATILASDLDNRWNDFPLRTTFVPFVFETLRYIAGDRVRKNEWLVAQVPESVPPRPGFTTLTQRGGDGRAPRRVAINVDSRESDLTRIPAEEFQAMAAGRHEVGAPQATVRARQQENRQQLWMYVLGGMIFVLVIESLVAGAAA